MMRPNKEEKEDGGVTNKIKDMNKIIKQIRPKSRCLQVNLIILIN